MSDLRDQMRRARETWFSRGAHEFLMRRPTVEQLRALSDVPWSEMLGKCIVDWRGVKVSDLVPGGTIADAPFDSEALIEWISDDPALLTALAAELSDRIAARTIQTEAAEKN